MRALLILALAAMPLLATADVIVPGETPEQRAAHRQQVAKRNAERLERIRAEELEKQKKKDAATATTATTATTVSAATPPDRPKPPVEAAAAPEPDRYTLPLTFMAVLGALAIGLLYVRRKRTP